MTNTERTPMTTTPFLSRLVSEPHALMFAGQSTPWTSALAELADICDRERVDLVLLAGDVFDTYLPSAEA